MKEEFENAKKWVEENEVCRFEGDMQDMEKSHALIFNIDKYLQDKGKERKFRNKANHVTNLLIMDFHRHVGLPTKGIDNIIMFGGEGSEYKILASREIRSQEIKEFQEFIDYINKYVNEEDKLKQLLKDFINKLSIPVKFCIGGFDFIYIILRSNHKILYDFEKIDEEYSYFSMIVTVSE